MRHLDRRRCAALLDDQRLGTQVGQVELELLGTVGRVQRRTGHASGAGQETARHHRPVRQHDGDPVVAADAVRVQRRQRGLDLAPQRAMAQRGAIRRAQRGGDGVGGGQQAQQGVMHGPSLM